MPMKPNSMFGILATLITLVMGGVAQSPSASGAAATERYFFLSTGSFAPAARNAPQLMEFQECSEEVD
jgi:hypothetical protein